DAVPAQTPVYAKVNE
nr:DNA topoisomerase I {peptide 7} [Micrococcus luteus, Peptide Partial, 15 aa] [Micrococcus luteus]